MNNSYELNEIKIEVTQKCPLNCLHCSSEANPSKNQELSEELVVRLINEAKEMGIEEITFSGGEPLIWEPLSNVLDLCNLYKMKVVLYTSGFPLIESPHLIEVLRRKNVYKVIVSLFGSSSEAHEGITRVHGSFNATIKTIDILNNLNVLAGIHFVAMKPNVGQLEELITIANRHQVNRKRIRSWLLCNGLLYHPVNYCGYP